MADRPRRVQLSRAKGWRMPANTVKVDRSTKWGRGNRHLVARLARCTVIDARTRADAESTAALPAALREIQLGLYGLPDGADSPQALTLLASLGWVIGLGAEVARVLEPGGVRARRLHGALRTLQAMCLAGYAWRTAHAVPMEQACTEAHQLLMQHQREARALKVGADYLAGRIQHRQVSALDVAGAEIYAENTA